jgi:lysophospholipase L1-like esterase
VAKTGWAVTILLPFIAALTMAPFVHGQGEPRGALYLGLGDSLAEGVGASRAGFGFMDRFFDYLRDKATGDRLVLVNRAVGGETSESFIWGGQLEAAVAMIGDPELDTRAVVVSLGGNDLLSLLRTGPCASDPASDTCRDAVTANLASFAVNYTQLLGRLRGAMDAQPGEKTLFVIAPYNAFSGTDSVYEAPTDRALLGADLTTDFAAIALDLANVGLNDLITCIGASAGAVVVDAYEPFRGRAIELTNIGFGDHHPNNAGHAIMGDALIQAFEMNRGY